MHRFTLSLIVLCFVAGMRTAAAGCDARYDASNNALTIPCISIVGDPNSYGVLMRDIGGHTFALASPLHIFDLLDPDVMSLRVLTTPIPVAVIIGDSRLGCWSLDQRATFLQIGNNIDIRLKLRRPGGQLRGVLDCAVQPPFAEAVNLVGVTNPLALTYSINGVAVTPSFSF